MKLEVVDALKATAARGTLYFLTLKPEDGGDADKESEDTGRMGRTSLALDGEEIQRMPCLYADMQPVVLASGSE